MGLDESALDALVERARRDIDNGRLPAAQLAVGYEGQVVLFETFGDADDDSRFFTYSAIKPFVSLTVMELAAEGLLDLDAPVAEYLPAFAANGKELVTVSHLLLHASGFPHARVRVEAFSDRSVRLATYPTWTLDWKPGSAYDYHPSSAHWVLGDLITEVTGEHHADAVHERVVAPVGIPRLLAIAEGEQGDVVDVVSIGDEPEAGTYREMFGVEPPETEVTNESLEAYNDPSIRAAGNPGGGGIARACDLALWYQAVLHDDGAMLRPEVKVDALTVVRQQGVDWTGVATNRTHAFVLAGDDGKATYRGHGGGASALAFGHNGAKGQIAAADPDTGVSYCFLTNGLERNDLIYGRRMIAIASRAVACGTRPT